MENEKSFVSNPLLLSIFFFTYKHTPHIPKKLNLFYKNAYEALFERHDLSKDGFKRDKYTELDVQDFFKSFFMFLSTNA